MVWCQTKLHFLNQWWPNSSYRKTVSFSLAISLKDNSRSPWFKWFELHINNKNNKLPLVTANYYWQYSAISRPSHWQNHGNFQHIWKFHDKMWNYHTLNSRWSASYQWLGTDCGKSRALAMELLLSCAEPSISFSIFKMYRHPRIILYMHPANERQCYIVLSFLTG